MPDWKSLSHYWPFRRHPPADTSPQVGASDQGDADFLTISQLIVQRQGRRRADALCERIARAVEQEPGISPHALAGRLNETQIVVLSEVDRLVQEGMLHVERSDGTLYPAATVRQKQTPARLRSERGRLLLAVLLMELYRRLREVPGTRIEATTHGLRLFVNDTCLVDAVLPAEGEYLWLQVALGGDALPPRRIADLRALFGAIDTVGAGSAKGLPTAEQIAG